MLRRLTPKQKALLRNVRRRGLLPKLYQRSSNRSGVSVHVPSLDLKRKAKVRNLKTVKKFPHAYDTEAQAAAPRRRVKRALKSKKKVRKHSMFHRLFNP